MYEYLSSAYDELHGSEQTRKLNIIKAELGLKPWNTVLDIGCGTGLSSILGCEITGIDCCDEMIEKSRKRINAMKGFAEELPFPDKSFDAVICVTALHNFSDINAAIIEMRRVSRGKIAISALKKSSRLKLIEDTIKNQLHIELVVDDATDRIFFCINKVMN